MNLWMALVLLCVASTPTLAEQKTLVSGDVDHGGFGGTVVKFSQIDGEFAVFAGGYGGWLINHTFMIGAGGYGLTNREPELTMGYGGVILEYIAPSNNLIHFFGNVLIGAGSEGQGAEQEFFVVEPAVHLELNVTKNVRVGMGGSYRYISGLGHRNSDLRGPSASFTIKFGKF